MSTSEWSDVVEGDELRGRDGQGWVVTHAGERLTLERHGKEPFTFPRPAMGQVELITASLLRSALPEQTADVAVAIAGLHLGGAVVAHQETADGPWIVQASGWSLADLHSHLSVFHDVPLTERPATLPELSKVHLRAHDAGKVTTPHVHNDTPYRQGGKVPW